MHMHCGPSGQSSGNACDEPRHSEDLLDAKDNFANGLVLGVQRRSRDLAAQCDWFSRGKATARSPVPEKGPRDSKLNGAQHFLLISDPVWCDSVDTDW